MSFNCELHTYSAHYAVKVNGTVHLAFPRGELISVQSYLDKGMYWLELYVGNQKIVSSYDTVEKWKAVLMCIEQILNK